MWARVGMRRWGSALALATLLLAGTLGGCSLGTPTAKASAPTATVFPAPVPLPTVDPTEAASACGADWTPPGPIVRAGELLIGPVHLTTLATPAFKLPDETPPKPLQVQFGTSTSGLLASADPPTNPTMDEHVGGYEINLCNSSPSQAHTLAGVGVRIDDFTPYAGQLNQWNICNGAYSRTGSTLGCGGAYFAAEYLRAVFASSDGPGSAQPARQVGSGRDDGADGPFASAGPLPLGLAPHTSVPINVGMTVPAAPGLYSFSFALTLDGAAPVVVAAPRPVLFAPVAHNWTATACQDAAMQAQIPAATDPLAFYVCPQG